MEHAPRRTLAVYLLYAALSIASGQTGRFAFSFVPPGLMAGIVVLILALAASAFAWHRRTL